MDKPTSLNDMADGGTNCSGLIDDFLEKGNSRVGG